MTELVRIRGRMVVVAMFAEAPKLDLFRILWRELRLCGVRVYEPEDYDRAIELVAGEELPLEQLITARRSLGDLQEIFEEIGSEPEMMKVLVDAQN